MSKRRLPPQPARDALVAADPAIARIHDELRAAVQELARSEQFESWDHLNARLAEVVAEMNARPERDFGGLSPNDVHRLVGAPWPPRGGPVTVARDLPAAAVRDHPAVRDMRVLLDLLADEGTVALTTKRRALPAKAARAWLARRGDDGAPTHPYDLLRRDGTAPRTLVRDADLGLVERVVEAAIDAALVDVDAVGLVLTEAGRRLRDPRKAGVLWELLVRTAFTVADFGPFAVPPIGAPSLQAGIAYTLCRFQRLDDTWRDVQELTELLVLPATLDAVDRMADAEQLEIDVMATAVDLYVLMPLVNLGLAECAPDEREPREPGTPPRFRYRPSTLMRRTVRFEVGAVH